MPRWTPESRERQRQLIQSWRPWEHSTGPTSEYGKQVSSQNNFYCSEAWQLWKSIQPALKRVNKAIADGEGLVWALAENPTVLPVLEQILRSHN